MVGRCCDGSMSLVPKLNNATHYVTSLVLLYIKCLVIGTLRILLTVNKISLSLKNKMMAQNRGDEDKQKEMKQDNNQHN